MISRVTAALLDIDGTFVRSNDAHAKAWSEAAAEFGFLRPLEFFRRLIGMGGDRILPCIDATLSAERKPGSQIAARRGEIFAERYLPGLRPTAGGQELVRRLFLDDIRCVVASSAKTDEIEGLLKAAGIDEYITVTTTSDDAGRSKPAPDIVTVALRKSRVSANEAVLVGDTPYDVEAGARAGVRVLAVRCGGWSDEALKGAAMIFNDPADILAHYEQTPFATTRRA
ncbi:MAG: HAD family hydrolase [Candidatus Eremiobacteraeota bacterium]|nr:HAD family hydrolase [Candidatus Eremiobacteraeota bacterium]